MSYRCVELLREFFYPVRVGRFGFCGVLEVVGIVLRLNFEEGRCKGDDAARLKVRNIE